MDSAAVCCPTTRSSPPLLVFPPLSFRFHPYFHFPLSFPINLASIPTPQPFYGLFRDHPGEPVPEENFWALWCKGRLTEADTLTIRLRATPSGLTSAYLHHPPYFHRPGALSAAQPTASKNWRLHPPLFTDNSFHVIKRILFAHWRKHKSRVQVNN